MSECPSYVDVHHSDRRSRSGSIVDLCIDIVAESFHFLLITLGPGISQVKVPKIGDSLTSGEKQWGKIN